MKVERQVEALEEEWNVDTDRCSAERDGNDESVMWQWHFSAEQKLWQTMLKADTWDFSENLKSIWRD